MGNYSISNFIGEYFFLDNFYPRAPIKIWGLSFLNSEAAYQAAKHPDKMDEFCNLSAFEAKKLGRSSDPRGDWDEVKQGVMYEVCFAKFSQNQELRRRLIETGEAELVEGNTWGDTYWGVCNEVGDNWLGKTLMKVREEIKR